MLANGFMNARTVVLYLSQQKVIVASFVLMGQFHARPFSKRKVLVAKNTNNLHQL
jgi:hypothetical protein